MGFIGDSVPELQSNFDNFTLEALSEAIDQQWVLDVLSSTGRQSERRRKLPADFMTWFVILMGLHRRLSYRNLLEKCFLSRWARRVWGAAPPDDSGISKARGRLGVEPLRALYETSADEWMKRTEGLMFHGRRVMAVDGTAARTEDTPTTEEVFGRVPASRGKTAYPTMVLLTLTDVGTGMFLLERRGGALAGEQTLVRDMEPDMPENALVLMDRGFQSRILLWRLMSRKKRDFVVRMCDKHVAAPVERLGPGDEIVDVPIPWKARTEAREAGTADPPNRLRLRMVTYTPKGGSEPVRLLTSLTDASIPAREIAELYHCRWEAETSFDAMKKQLCEQTTISKPTVFRSKSPELVLQEYYGILIAFNAVLFLMSRCGSTRDPEAEVFLGFRECLQRVREGVHDMMQLPNRRLRERYDQMLNGMKRAKISKRPGRKYPRAVKIKMSRYPLKHNVA